MPKGPGTYGSKVGRPPKKKKMIKAREGTTPLSKQGGMSAADVKKFQKAIATARASGLFSKGAGTLGRTVLSDQDLRLAKMLAAQNKKEGPR